MGLIVDNLRELMDIDKEIQECGYLRKCCVCDGWFDIDDMEQLEDGRWICDDCLIRIIRRIKEKEMIGGE